MRWLRAFWRRLRPASPDLTPHDEKTEIRRRLSVAERDTERLERLAHDYRDFGKGLR